MKRKSPTADESSRRLLVGLGNPGEKYAETRHNLGFRVIDELAKRSGRTLGRSLCNALISDGDPVLVKPLTYMNRSGYSVRCLAERFETEAESCLIVYDDVHLPLGRLRFRAAGSPGGHRGMESVINNMRSKAVPRVRVGVGAIDGPPAGEDLADYVLEPFRSEEQEEVERTILKAADACLAWLEEEPQQVMGRFNG